VEKVFLLHVKKQLWSGGKEKKAEHGRALSVLSVSVYVSGWVGKWRCCLLPAACCRLGLMGFAINRNIFC
jgi:hypothetical protein